MIEKTCAITGHRIVEKNFDESILQFNLIKLVEEGYNRFLCGMAIGFDALCVQALIKIRRSLDIKIIACIPCESQPEKYSATQREKYFEMLEACDEKIILSAEYENGCMQKRNRYMVDNCSLLFAYLHYLKGGTYYTVKYAQKKGKKILYL